MTNFNFDVLPAAPVRGGVEPEGVATVAALVNAAPRALTLAEVVAVLGASGIEAPAASTVRSYLNRAAADGRITKPSRQSYAAAAAAVEGEAQVEGSDEGDDPLADL
jgi:hypothetical protein